MKKIRLINSVFCDVKRTILLVCFIFLYLFYKVILILKQSAMRRLFFLLFVGVFLFSCSDSSINEESENIAQNIEQRSLTSMYTELINSFEHLSVRGSDGISMLYPDYFGGAYVKDSKMIVFLTKKSNKDFAKEDLSKRIDLNYVSFMECDYSYSELMNLDEWLFDFFTSSENKQLLNTLHVDGWNIDKDKNRIVIKLGDCSSFYINEFKSKVINSPMIDFVKSRGRLKQQVTYTPGTISVDNHRGASASLGYRVKSSLYSGFLVSGHFANAVNYPVKYKNTSLGICTVVGHSGSVDASFIRYNDGVSVSNTISGPSGNVTLGLGVDIVSETGDVFLSGAHTRTSGAVISTGETIVNDENVMIRQCTSVWYAKSPVGGDSGGICYSANKNVVGLHVGVDEYGYGYYCLANEIHARLKVSRY